MKNLGLVITDGVGFRNYILSGFVTEAQKRFDAVVIYSCLPASVYDGLDVDCRIVELELMTESFRTWFFRKAKELAHLKRHARRNFGFRDTLGNTRAQGHSPRALATRLLFGLSSVFNGERTIRFWNFLQRKSAASHHLLASYEALLRNEGIDLLFFTHQRPPFIAPLIQVARRMRIPTAAFIFSWDNLASKGRMAGDFDYYLVWSRLMEKDLREFYPHVRKDRIAVIGTPQFEPYVQDHYGYSREALDKRFGTDPSRPIVLFTCNDASSQNDPLYLELLAKALTEGRFTHDFNLIARTSPAESPERFAHLKEKYPCIIWNYPDWRLSREGHQEPWSQRVPSAQDLSDLKSLLQHAAFTINVMSTITIDSFLFGKPVINPVFGSFDNGMYPDQKYMRYRHLEPLVACGASHVVRNEAEFADAVNRLLDGDDGRSALRRDFVDLQIGQPLEGTSARIAETLRKWAD